MLSYFILYCFETIHGPKLQVPQSILILLPWWHLPPGSHFLQQFWGQGKGLEQRKWPRKEKKSICRGNAFQRVMVWLFNGAKPISTVFFAVGKTMPKGYSLCWHFVTKKKLSMPSLGTKKKKKEKRKRSRRVEAEWRVHLYTAVTWKRLLLFKLCCSIIYFLGCCLLVVVVSMVTLQDVRFFWNTWCCDLKLCPIDFWHERASCQVV